MADSFKAVVINNQNENFTREVKELSLDHFKDGEVLVKIDYSDLNWKDAMILKDGGKLVKEYQEYLVLIFLEPLLSQNMRNLKKEIKLSLIHI